MKACRYERELVTTLRSGAWPLGADPELRLHVERCRRCSETVLVAGTLLAAARAGAPPSPPLGTLWWRAQLERQRRDAARVARPLTWAWMLGFASALAGLIALALWQFTPALSWIHQLGVAAGGGMDGSLVLLAGLATLAGSGLAVWLVARKAV